MTDPGLEELRRRLGAPVPPREEFARSLLDRLERALAASEDLSDEEIAAERAEELPLREAMSVISADPLASVDPSAVLGEVGAVDPTEPGVDLGTAEPPEPGTEANRPN